MYLSNVIITDGLASAITDSRQRAARRREFHWRASEDSVSRDPRKPPAIEEAAGYVRDTIKHFTDDERKQILDSALRELDSKLAVSDGG